MKTPKEFHRRPCKSRTDERESGTIIDLKSPLYRAYSGRGARHCRAGIFICRVSAEVWHGEQASQYTLAEQARTKASTQAALSAQLRTLDINLFSQWLDAYAHGDQRLQLFYRTRFRPEFAKVFEAWVLTRPQRIRRRPCRPSICVLIRAPWKPRRRVSAISQTLTTRPANAPMTLATNMSRPRSFWL